MPDKAIEPLFHAMFTLFRVIGRQFRSDRDPRNITPAQFHALTAIREHGTVKLMTIADLLSVRGPTATRVIDALEQKGLLIKDRDPQDRRIFWLRLTSTGGKLLDQSKDQHLRELEEMVGRLSASEQETLTVLVNKMVSHIE